MIGQLGTKRLPYFFVPSPRLIGQRGQVFTKTIISLTPPIYIDKRKIKLFNNMCPDCPTRHDSGRAKRVKKQGKEGRYFV